MSSSFPVPASSSSLSSSAGGSPPRSLTLRRWAQERYLAFRTSGFCFRVEVAQAVGMPREVFRYLRRDATDLVTGLALSRSDFSGVCSPADLEDYPAGAPWPAGHSGGGVPFFRLDYVELVLASQATADEAWAVISEELTTLLDTLGLMDHLVLVETLELGG